MDKYKIIHGNSLEELKKIQDNSVDSICTDPPYELGFMNKSWDNTGIANNIQLWKEVYRVLKPGGHMLAFSGTRTYHRMVCAIEDAGFEIRDQLAWIYGSGFPKSQNVSKMIDKKAGATRKVIGKKKGGAYSSNNNTGICEMRKNFTNTSVEKNNSMADITEPATDDAKKWDGWGTALKPAQEPIVLARKPLSETTVAKNVIKHGTGAINIDDSRVKIQKGDEPSAGNRTATFGTQETVSGGDGSGGWESNDKGRWPANVIHDGSDEVVELFPDNRGRAHPGKIGKFNKESGGGSAARFFYCPKANKEDRDEGMALPSDKVLESPRREDGSVIYKETHPNEWAEAMKKRKRKDKTSIGAAEEKLQSSNNGQKNNHPTVKPVNLMKYLVKMITPKDGIVLDPFMGSGSTGKAAMLLGYNFIGIDMTAEYIPIAEARIKAALEEYNKQNEKNEFFTD